MCGIISFLISKIEFQRFNCKADVGFLIDGSGSINHEEHGGSPYNWNLIKDFVLVLAKNLNISEDGAHMAVGVFSNEATLDIKFSDYTDYESFEQAVLQLRYPSLLTYTLKGYDLAYNQMFSESNGMRSNVPKTLIVVTDGICARNCSLADDASCRETGCKSDYCHKEYFMCPNEFARWGKMFRNRKIKTIGIGVGERTNETEIIEFVGQSNYYKKKSFNQILTKRFQQELVLCEGKKPLNKLFKCHL